MVKGDDIDALAATLLRTFEQEDVTFFVGAGISLEAPASLPSANDLKWHILEVLAGHSASAKDRPLLQQYLDTHMLELFVQDLKETLGPGAADVIDVFRGGDPNPYHRLIARLAKRKLVKRVITTNFDCLIERALADEGVEYHALTTEHDFAEAIVRPEDYPAFHVIKLHGTVAFMDGCREIPGRSDVKAISPFKLEMRKLDRFLKDQGVAVFEYGFERTVSAKETLIGSLDRLGLSLSEVTSELLVKHLQKSTVIVIGWNGFDLDIAPLFVEHATKVVWLVHDSPLMMTIGGARRSAARLTMPGRTSVPVASARPRRRCFYWRIHSITRSTSCRRRRRNGPRSLRDHPRARKCGSSRPT